MDRRQFLEYIDHFNNKRYDALVSYFTPDITVEYFDNAYGTKIPARTLHGPAEFTASYKALNAHTREILELGDFISAGELVFAELYTEFHTFKDAISNAGEPWKEGEIRIWINWVMYTMAGDKMKRIRIAHFRNVNPTKAKYK
jgi:hypothetical protein